MIRKPIEVVAVILQANNKVLIGQRMKGDTNAGKWEFPGGKIRQNEQPEAALTREIQEELGIHVDQFKFFDQVQFDYPNYSVNIRFYLADLESEIECVKESHDELVWISPNQINEFDFLEANRNVLQKLIDNAN
jgi:8-oxo-dGTP diphosphatase